jgi:serine/threonine-protein kinase RsbW
MCGSVDVETDRCEARLATRDDTSREARRITTRFLVDHGVDGYVKDLTAIVTSELVTNAAVHGEEPIDLRVRLSRDTVSVEVTDAHQSDDGLEALEPTPTETRGRGLTIVQSLTRRWGVVQHPDDGKTVWAEIAIPQA